ncbi:hypothetical protein [Salinicoccus roseus]|uniref:Uncharacterized protein n=1 Tax=Salinicoccus roseus TaxID=45670 RepID=A0ABT4YL23_9STAP|nr:hypothetical protein [Salinicoccus roseus]MDB0581399.1 hypothetical protein [Salinicoccus roseus]
MVEEKQIEDKSETENKKDQEQLSNKQTCLGCLVVLGIVILLFGGCGALFGVWDSGEDEPAESATEDETVEETTEEATEEETTEETTEEATEEVTEEPTEEETEEPAAELTPMEEIEQAATDVVGEERLVEVNGLITEGTGTVQITFQANDNFSTSWVKGGIRTDMADILFALKEMDYTFENAGISATFPLVDQYGNEEDGNVIEADFDQEALNQINPENQYTVEDNLHNIGWSWWEHPALSE